MDLSYSNQEKRFQKDARAFLEANVPKGLASGDTREGFAQHLEWEKLLFKEGYAAVSWPEEYGGRGASLVEWLIFEEEYYRAGAPSRVTQNGIFLLAPTLFEFGTQDQKDKYLQDIASASYLWAQAWSEPNAGSDLAALKSKGEQVDGGWLLSGQKTWCTRGAFCDGVFGLFRTDPESQRHRGLTYFMVPLDAKGVTVRGVDRLDGDEGFADVFFDNVFVPDSEIIGDVHQGWKVAMATTSSERGLSLRSPGRFLATANNLKDLYLKSDPSSASIRDRVIQAHIDSIAYDLFTKQTVTKMIEGESLGAKSSLNKIFWSEMDVQIHETALDILQDRAEIDPEWMKGYQFSLAGPIYAGTNEIQRNIVAERVLGLPRK